MTVGYGAITRISNFSATCVCVPGMARHSGTPASIRTGSRRLTNRYLLNIDTACFGRVIIREDINVKATDSGAILTDILNYSRWKSDLIRVCGFNFFFILLGPIILAVT